MKQHERNGWFHSSEFIRAASAIHKVATEEHTRWLNLPSCKYLLLRVDQRTGDFIILNQRSEILEAEVIYTMFPELRD
jgi:hypothetical protein